MRGIRQKGAFHIAFQAIALRREREKERERARAEERERERERERGKGREVRGGKRSHYEGPTSLIE